MEMEIDVPDGPYCAQQLPSGKEGKLAWHQCRFVRSVGGAGSCDAFKTPLKEVVYADTPLYDKCAACHAACREAEIANK